MAWQTVDTIPISVDAAITPQRAEAVRSALLDRALPLARLVDGRPEPLATASLLQDGTALALLTAAHIFDHVTVGDLVIPLPREGGWLCLRSTRTRVLIQPDRDVAVLTIDDSASARRLRANWTPVPRWQLARESDAWGTRVYVVVGYPVSQARRFDGAVYLKPLVLFTTAVATDRFAYARTATRVDGQHIHTPELDGVSGALVWALQESESVGCLLRGAAVQVAFLHGRYLRTEPLPGLLGRLRHH